ncbi:hypothetical protein CPB83DRAFT_907611 [Crepidotus variabilis]|uniref:C2H2-type domain-containing protein n=1 Tax=Crepidotus variabilis TaxID=179855 RepID=A0A9P6JNH5_9AGAR|nr:hypothetical protein CPB83DRAFT_907611 [Crepidotus variabilis]
MTDQHQNTSTVLHLCKPCGIGLQSRQTLHAHLQTRRHVARISGRFGVGFCVACAVNVTGGTEGWTEHIGGGNHTRRVVNQGVQHPLEPEQARDLNGEIYCTACQVMIPGDKWSKHEQKEQHMLYKAYLKYQAALIEATEGRHGITIQGDFDFGFLDPVVVRSNPSSFPTLSATIHALDAEPKSRLVRIQLKSMVDQTGGVWLPNVTRFSVAVTEPNWVMTPLSSTGPLSLTITFKAKDIGRYVDTIEFIFETGALLKRWVITREVTAIIGAAQDHEAVKPTAPFVPSARAVKKRVLEVVEGVKPPSLNAIPYVKGLPKATIPPKLALLLSNGEFTSRLVDEIRLLLPSALAPGGRDLAQYDISRAALQREGRFYFLNVPGLAERRPSVLIGDQMLVQDTREPGGRWYEGHVHIVRRDAVGLCFHDSFGRTYSVDKRYDVQFKLNLIPQRRQHQALGSHLEQIRILFPQARLILPPTENLATLNLQYLNPFIESNYPQVQAVTSIVTAAAGSPPFIVFGPPGTGKTVTIVEGIRQLLNKEPSTKILAYAPSNSAADLIALRLAKSNENLSGLDNNNLFRFYAPSRSNEQVPQELGDFLYISSEGHFSVPSMEKMLGFRVVVTTCVSASVAHGIGMPQGHFSHMERT